MGSVPPSVSMRRASTCSVRRSCTSPPIREKSTSRSTSSEAAVDTTSRIRNEIRIRVRTSPSSGRRPSLRARPSDGVDTPGRYPGPPDRALLSRPPEGKVRSLRAVALATLPTIRATPSAYWEPEGVSMGSVTTGSDPRATASGPGGEGSPTGAVGVDWPSACRGRRWRRAARRELGRVDPDPVFDLDPGQGIRVLRAEKGEIDNRPERDYTDGLGDDPQSGAHEAPLSGPRRIGSRSSMIMRSV